MRTRFAFVHVPKSAGSSIKNAVARSCDPATVAPSELDRVLFGDFDGFDRMPEHTRATIAVDGAHALAGYDIAMGHFGCSSFAPHFAPDETMTVLREPRSRLLSHYTFWRGWPEHRHADWHPYAASLVAAAATWEEFVTEPALASQTDNLVARMLLAPHPLLPGDGFIDLDDHDRVAEDALAMLERLGFVDVVERGPDLWAGLSSWLDADVRAERTLVTDRAGDVDWHAELTPAAATAVRHRTAIDTRLWSWAARQAADVSALAESTFHRKLVSVASPSPAPSPTTSTTTATATATSPDDEAAASRSITSATRRLIHRLRR